MVKAEVGGQDPAAVEDQRRAGAVGHPQGIAQENLGRTAGAVGFGERPGGALAAELAVEVARADVQEVAAFGGLVVPKQVRDS